MANALSRPDQISDGDGTIASWAYLGLGTVVMQNYDAADDSYLTMQNGSTGDAGDKYTGLNRFGWLVETIWKHADDDLVHSSYGRNRVGGVVWRRDDLAHALSVSTQDNYYEYDGLQQVTLHQRRALTGTPYSGIDPLTQQQQENFTFDQTGNWLEYVSADPSLDQTRTHDAANQIASLTNPSGVVQAVYDPVGNMTTTPQPADWTSGYDLTWDAWNRLVEVSSGETYAYDALSRQLTRTIETDVRAFYYNRDWRVIEEWFVGSPSTLFRDFVWSPYDRWNLIRRQNNDSGTLGHTRFVLKDYLDPVAILSMVDDTPTVLERYGYDAFGAVRFMDPEFGTLSDSAYIWYFLFHGEFMDPYTGLYNYGYRYYHPQLGRWISRDPIGESGGLNLYAFTQNNPTATLDMLGLWYYQEIRHDSINNIMRDHNDVAAYTGDMDESFARAKAKIDPSTKHEFTRTSQGTKCCVSVKSAKRINVRVVTVLPTAPNNVYDSDGMKAVALHEARRRLVYDRAHAAYISGVSTNGGDAKKCNPVCRDTYNQAENELSRWLDALQEARIEDYDRWIFAALSSIGKENDRWVEKGGLRDHYSQIQHVGNPPPPTNDPRCPKQ